MASKLRAKNGTFKLYMTPEQRMALERERTTGYDFYAEQLVRESKIKGLEVVELDVADSTTAGDVLIFASDLSKNYAFGLAQDVMVEYVPTMHAGKCYKGTAFIDHKFLQIANNWAIIAHAWNEKLEVEGTPADGEVGEAPSKEGLTFKVKANGVETDVTSSVELVEPETWEEASEEAEATWEYVDSTHSETITWTTIHKVTEPEEEPPEPTV